MAKKQSFYISLTGNANDVKRALVGVIGDYAQMFPSAAIVNTKSFRYEAFTVEDVRRFIVDTSDGPYGVGLKVLAYVEGAGLKAYVRKAGQNYFVCVVGNYAQLSVISRYTGAHAPKAVKPGNIPGFYSPTKGTIEPATEQKTLQP